VVSTTDQIQIKPNMDWPKKLKRGVTDSYQINSTINRASPPLEEIKRQDSFFQEVGVGMIDSSPLTKEVIPI
jgi:hypothetical protein